MFQDGEYEAAAREVGLGCEVEWFPGGWMSRQRFAGRLGGKAEFACGLPVGVWGRRRCAGRQGGKVGVPCDLMGVSE